jgi:hypothetical protein
MAGIGGGGTSKAYLLDRLEKAERFDLLEGISRGRISVLAAAEAAGFFRRPAPTGRGSPNAAKRRRFQIQALLRGTNGPRHRP